MQSILDAINEWIKEILIGAINGNLSTMFGDVNEKVGTIATEVGKTPQGWNASIFSMIQTLSENVIIPIAGLVITYVLCVELISMVTEKNNMHDVDTFMFFKWFFKAWVAVYLVTHTFNITMAVFDVAQRVVSGAAGVIGGNTNIDVTAALSSMQDGLDAMEIPELLLLVMETSLVSLCMKIMSVLITVILYGRMIEIYLYCSVSPILSDGDRERFKEEKPVIGNCPRCGSSVYEGRKNYYCENRDCTFAMWKNDRFFEERKTAFTPKLAAALLKSGKANIKRLYSPKTGKTYDGTVVLADTGGKYVNYRIEIAKKK